jgi:hypothetical protein
LQFAADVDSLEAHQVHVVDTWQVNITAVVKSPLF